MKSFEEILKSERLHIQNVGADGLRAYLSHPLYRLGDVAIIFSFGGGWEHASVSLKKRCPTWEEMCMVKDIFWKETECVLQFHPPKSEYVNLHPFCLHMWKQVGVDNQTPEAWMI